MPKFLSVLTVAIVLGACAALVYRAQETTPPEKLLAVSATSGEQATDGNKPDEASGSAKPGAAAASLPAGEVSPTPTPKPKRSWFSWLFGSHKKEATPAPVFSTPSPTPTLAAVHKTPHHPSATPVSEPPHVTSPEEATTPKPGKATPTPKPTPYPETDPTDPTQTARCPLHGSKPVTPKPETKPEASTPASKPDKVSSAHAIGAGRRSHPPFAPEDAPENPAQLRQRAPTRIMPIEVILTELRRKGAF